MNNDIIKLLLQIGFVLDKGIIHRGWDLDYYKYKEYKIFYTTKHQNYMFTLDSKTSPIGCIVLLHTHLLDELQNYLKKQFIQQIRFNKIKKLNK